jgi:hypothetical protein
MGLVRELDRLSRNLFCHSLGSLALCRTADRAKKDARLATARAQGAGLANLSFPKILSAWNRGMKENQSIIRRDACHPPSARNVRRQPFQVAAWLEVENLFLRHQLNVALRRAPRHLRLRVKDRALLLWMTWLWPRLLGLSRVVQPDTILRWHRAGFRAYWRWKSRGWPRRP